jgi:diguanylate cyclase (GGDEF)-like protein
MRVTSDHPSVRADVLLDGRVPQGWAWLLVIGALALVYALDHRTGAVPLQHLYYLPIIFAAVRFGRGGGTLAAAAAVLLYHLANPHLLTFRYGELDLVQILLFVAVALIAAKLARDRRRLHALATTDDLTGLHNLRSFEVRLGALVRASLPATPMSMLVLDVDRLKALNDAHGHLTGADAVRTVGHLIARSMPPDALACRYGGDEFVIALPRCTESDARGIANELRLAVSECSPGLAGTAFPTGTLSISIGIACRAFGPAATRSAAAADAAGEDLFRAADAALYRSKREGRNRVTVDGDRWVAAT